MKLFIIHVTNLKQNSISSRIRKYYDLVLSVANSKYSKFCYNQVMRRKILKGFGQTDTNFSYPNAISELTSNTTSKNWNLVKTKISSLLANSDISKSADSLVEPLQYLQNKVVNFKDGDPDDSDVNQTLADLSFLAKAEASATINDRLVNNQLLIQRLNNLSAHLESFFGEIGKLKAIWYKIANPSKIRFLSLRRERDQIGIDIKTMPLRPEDRASLQTQLKNLQAEVSRAQQLMEASTLAFVSRTFVLVAIGTLSYVILMILTREGLQLGLHQAKKYLGSDKEESK